MAKKRRRRKNKNKFKNLKCPFNGDPSRIDYKDVYTIKKYITTRGRILQSERTGVSQKCQRKLAREIKKARYMALIPTNDLLI